MPASIRLPNVLAAAAAAALGSALAYPLAIRPWHLRWGATEDEVRRELPGDDLVSNPVLETTRAITIAARPEAVWPWVAQIGQGRGGFYSHTLFQNLLRSDIHNADRVVSELQDLRAGDIIWLASPQNLGERAPHFRVVEAVPGRALILVAPLTAPEMAASWTFVLEPLGAHATRLVVRYRSFAEPAWKASAFSLEPVAFVMERRMLLGIKERAERAWAEQAGAAPSTLLDEVLPEYDFRGVESISIHASPEQIFRALQEVTLGDMPLAYVLGTIRYLPGLITGRQRRQEDELTRPFFEVAMPLVLAEDSNQEVVIGSIGKLHDLLDQQVVLLPDADAFRRFHHPDYQKFVQSFRIAGGSAATGYGLVAEHRTHALSPAARRKFALYWYLVVGWGGNLLLRMLLRAVKRRAEGAASSAAAIRGRQGQ